MQKRITMKNNKNIFMICSCIAILLFGNAYTYFAMDRFMMLPTNLVLSGAAIAYYFLGRNK